MQALRRARSSGTRALGRPRRPPDDRSRRSLPGQVQAGSAGRPVTQAGATGADRCQFGAGSCTSARGTRGFGRPAFGRAERASRPTWSADGRANVQFGGRSVVIVVPASPPKKRAQIGCTPGERESSRPNTGGPKLTGELAARRWEQIARARAQTARRLAGRADERAKFVALPARRQLDCVRARLCCGQNSSRSSASGCC